MNYPRIVNSGECAIVVEFENRIDPKINSEVKALYDLLKSSEIPGIVDLIPTYCSVFIQYDPMQIRYEQMVFSTKQLLGQISALGSTKKKIYRIPVCYGGEYGPDLKDVAEYVKMTEDEVVAIHAGTPYLIYMLGFQPGFAYLGGMDESIAMPRLTKPRTKIAAGSVGIANSQTGIYPLSSPAGWRLIGTTPVRVYDPDRGTPILYEAGDYIEFVSVDETEYKRIKAEVEAGRYECETVFEDEV